MKRTDVACFQIQGRLPSLNDMIHAMNANRWKGATMKKMETERCQWAIMAGHVPFFKVPVSVKFRWIEPNLKRDPDNVSVGAKFILDALTVMERIPDDSRKWIHELVHEFPAPDAKRPRVEVEIRRSALNGGSDVE